MENQKDSDLPGWVIMLRELEKEIEEEEKAKTI